MTRTTIKKHKGKLIELTYRTKAGTINNISGEIIANTKQHIVFDVNKEGI